MTHRHWLSRAEARTAILECCLLAIACLITYELVTRLLVHVYSVSRADDMLGGMWAVIATVFVSRDSYQHSVAAAVSRMAATSVSFVFCLIYLIFLPFHAWALALLIGASALAVTLMGRPGDAVTAGVTTAVVLVVAAVSPHDAWQQPILPKRSSRRRSAGSPALELRCISSARWSKRTPSVTARGSFIFHLGDPTNAQSPLGIYSRASRRDDPPRTW
jgi:hypothetical protein